MAWRGIVGMIVVALVLGVVCVIDAHLFGTPEEREEAERKVFVFEEDAIGKFEIGEGDGAFTLEKGTDSLWYITEPIPYLADQTTAENVPFELRTMRKIRTVSLDDSADLATYGLKEPRATVRFWVTEEPDRVSVGDKDAEGNVYILVEGKEWAVCTVQESLLDVLSQPIDQFRERRLIPFETYNVQALTLRQGAWGMEWLKLEDDWWVKSAETVDRADAVQIDEILRRIQGLRAVGFVDGVTPAAADPGGLAVGSSTIRIDLKNDEVPREAHLGAATERDGEVRVPARRVPLEESMTVLLLREEALEDFGRGFSDFRSRTLAHFSLYDVEGFSYRAGGEEVIVRKEDGGWKITSPREIEADADEMRMLLKTLQETRIDRFVDDSPEDLAPYALEEAREIGISTGEEEKVYRLGDPAEDGTVHAMRVGMESVFAVRPTGLPAGPREAYLRLLRRRVLDFSTFDAVSLEVRAGEEKRSFRKEEGKWKDGEEESREASEIVLALASLQAARFVDDSGDDRDWGLHAPSLVVTVEMMDGTRHEVRLAESVDEGGTYARVEGSDLVFRPNPSLVANLRSLFQ